MPIERRRYRREGQALVELAFGMFTLALVVSTLCGFCVFMARSLRAQNSARTGSSEGNGEVEVGINFGSAVIETMKVKERCQMPAMMIVK